MPHYNNGEEAKVGDLVKGHGYNVKHEIIGKVVNVRPGESCTLTVAYVGRDTPIFNLYPYSLDKPFARAYVESSYEYGDTKSFDKI